MTKDYSTTASRRLHQFTRLVTILALSVWILFELLSGGTLSLSFSLVTLFSAIVGVLAAEVWDWITWYISELLVGA